jgi:hypothetical protein
VANSRRRTGGVVVFLEFGKSDAISFSFLHEGLLRILYPTNYAKSKAHFNLVVASLKTTIPIGVSI